jgi:DNA polymerase III subunit epsilon
LNYFSKGFYFLCKKAVVKSFQVLYLPFKIYIMELKLNKPICFFDLETTGVDVAKDRIVEISIFKIYPNGNKESKTWLVNPTIPIPPQTTALHGITNEKVANEPTFKQLASQIYAMIKDSDLGGYNSDRFDIPLLAEELLRAEIDFDMKNRVSIDVQTIFHKKEERTLGAAYKFYCKKDLENAHTAAADTEATYEILKAQLAHYPDLQNDIKWLSEFTTRKKIADFAGMIAFDKDGDEIFTFGKHKGIKVTKVLETEAGYYSWIQNADFPLYTKKVLTAIKLRKLSTK